MRLAASLQQGDANILLTSYLTPNSRMMIRRRLGERLDAVAGFLAWDPDPYLVITHEGRLVWIVDGYTTSDSHPFSRARRPGKRRHHQLYAERRQGHHRRLRRDHAPVHLRAGRSDYPSLQEPVSRICSCPSSAMPADLRAHARYPEVLFSVQAELYRTYHMTNPQAFYNKEDLWDLASFVSRPGTRSRNR